MRPINRYLSNKIKASDIVADDKNIKNIVRSEIARLGVEADLNHIDVSGVTNFDYLFDAYGHFGFDEDDNNNLMHFNGDISKWITRNVKSMNATFRYCKKFNCDISEWMVDNVSSMDRTFCGCESFNQDISKWDVGNVRNMEAMFIDCTSFDQDLSKWNVKNVKCCAYMFDKCENMKLSKMPLLKYN